eukprot:scaffold43886_cov61-Phaeocystis_antarctica.AAC.4
MPIQLQQHGVQRLDGATFCTARPKRYCQVADNLDHLDVVTRGLLVGVHEPPALPPKLPSGVGCRECLTTALEPLSAVFRPSGRVCRVPAGNAGRRSGRQRGGRRRRWHRALCFARVAGGLIGRADPAGPRLQAAADGAAGVVVDRVAPSQQIVQEALLFGQQLFQQVRAQLVCVAAAQAHLYIVRDDIAEDLHTDRTQLNSKVVVAESDHEEAANWYEDYQRRLVREGHAVGPVDD